MKTANRLLHESSPYLLQHGVLVQFDAIVSRFPVDESNSKTLPFKLSEHQEAAREEVLSLFAQKDIVLLHGITGSGKTEVYIDLIKKALDGGGQVLYLLPEIALTAQIVTRLIKVFGNRLGVYHSKFSDNERVEVWNGILSGRFSVVVGVRSAIFLPFHNLSLIIVDEEHESSYKQYDPAPRYNAREVALMLASYHKAKTLLGSATPSVETYYNCKSGRWGLVTMQVASIKEAEQHLLAKNATFTGPKTRPDGAWQIFIQDPDGHYVELTEIV